MSKSEAHKELSDLSKRIRSARETARLSQADLGKGIGLSDKSISAYEQGRSVPPIDKLRKIAEQTQHPLSYFTEENIEHIDLLNKLSSIERELNEVKRLLRKAE